MAGRWAEGCACHSDSHDDEHFLCPPAGAHIPRKERKKKQKQKLTSGPKPFGGCPFRGRRAPELAGGGQLMLQAELLVQDKEELARHLHAAPKPERAQLALDIQDARQRMMCHFEYLN